MAAAGSSDALLYGDDENVLVTGEAVELDLHATSFVLAAAGAAIDFVLYYAGAIGVLLLLLFLFAIKALPSDTDAQAAIALSAVTVMLIVVPIVVELLSHGKSLGRLAVGARIVRDDGGAITFRHAFIRSLVGFLEIFGLFGAPAAIAGLLNSRSKRLGDMLAGTYSQYERVPKVQPMIFAVPLELTDWARTADVARIPDRLGLRMTQFLKQAGTLTPVARDQFSRQLANEAAVYVSPVPSAAAPELFLAAVIALRRDREFQGLVLEQERLAPLSSALTGLPYAFPDRD